MAEHVTSEIYDILDQVEACLKDLLQLYSEGLNETQFQQEKDLLLGAKQSLFDAIVALYAVKLKKIEIHLKNKTQETLAVDQVAEETEIKIIEQFAERIAEKTKQDVRKPKASRKRTD